MSKRRPREQPLFDNIDAPGRGGPGPLAEAGPGGPPHSIAPFFPRLLVVIITIGILAVPQKGFHLEDLLAQLLRALIELFH